jgi:hypothetical protein
VISKLTPVILAVLLVAGGAAADERALAAEPADPFWVQDRPLSSLVSSDLVAQDRRYLGAFGYGVNLTPPARGGLAAEGAAGAGFAQLGQFSINNWHFGIDVLQPNQLGRASSVAQLAMNYGGQVSNNLALSVGPTVSLGGASLSPLTGASSSGGFLRRFQGETGLRDYGLRGSAVYSLGDNWALTGVLGFRRSLSELGVSSSDEQFFSVLGLGYRF